MSMNTELIGGYFTSVKSLAKADDMKVSNSRSLVSAAVFNNSVALFDLDAYDGDNIANNTISGDRCLFSNTTQIQLYEGVDGTTYKYNDETQTWEKITDQAVVAQTVKDMGESLNTPSGFEVNEYRFKYDIGGSGPLSINLGADRANVAGVDYVPDFIKNIFA
ncbi:MAG: hypothetical protein PHC34_07400 [Candidatus Gastranaerophilales bacterium]|nr:hypothetical protein [Candidatus Gastranaerophilales bacterium]